ncbi:MAG: hypothetical protein WBP11_10925 [Dokdonella sp.]
MFFRLSLIAVVALLGACSDTSHDATPTAAVSPAATNTVATPNANVVFTATPASVRRCDVSGGKTSVTLNWDVRAASISFVTIMVGDRVFSQGDSNGTSTTGNWVQENTVFTLLNAATKKPLATLQVPFVDC